MNILFSMLLSLLPQRYREMFTSHSIPSGGAVASGFLETLISVGLLIHGYFLYSDERMAALSVSVINKAGEKGGESAIMGMGTIFMLEYLVHLSTLVLIFFIFEGVVRAIAAIAGGDVLPSLPLQVLAFVHTKLQAQNHERSLGRRVCDEVYACGEHLQIASCRPKPWTQLTSICYEGVFYELIDEKKGPVPHRFVYILRKKPQTAVIRGIYSYDPDEVLQSR
ncbi:MAG: hypothetical protein WCF22_00055 [Candidatus Sulfotelmatobacter sp.]